VPPLVAATLMQPSHGLTPDLPATFCLAAVRIVFEKWQGELAPSFPAAPFRIPPVLESPLGAASFPLPPL